MTEAIWHDVECAGYDADLPTWLALAREAGDPVLDLGAGTGRVAVELARSGHAVVAVDSSPDLVAALSMRAREGALDIDAVVADVRSFELRRRFRLAFAAMQVVQLLGGRDGRRRMLSCVKRHLEPGGKVALAVADPFEAEPLKTARPPLPDIREEGGWVYSSTPVAMYPDGDATVIERVRQAVSPTGELDESVSSIRLDTVAPAALEEDGRACGFSIRERAEVPYTEDYVGSTVVVMEAA